MPGLAIFSMKSVWLSGSAARRRERSTIPNLVQAMHLTQRPAFARLKIAALLGNSC
jgi:hypothetical protein